MKRKKAPSGLETGLNMVHPEGIITEMGWPMGLEPTTLGITIRCSNQLSYGHHRRASLVAGWAHVNENAGLEEFVTHCALELIFDEKREISYT